MDWTCTSCSGQNPPASAFCGACGSRRAGAAPEAPPWQCRQCGSTNPAVSAFCGGCGSGRSSARQEELRLVTALFADISGFTTLADRLDTEELHEVVSPLVRGLTEIAEQYGGFVEKYAGDAVLVVYGAPVTHEDDPQRALLAALEMHARLPSLLAPLGPDAAHLTVHVGVNTGRVIARQAGSVAQSDYAVLGDSVILAQRLESVCPSGETYVGASTQALCAQDFDFEDVGLLTLKGKLEPVQAYRLLGRRSADASSRRPLVGRERELAQTDDVLDAVLAGRSAVAAVVGEPGLGKSRLLAEVRTRAAAREVQWLSARCLSYGAALPYWPLRDLLRTACGARTDASPEELERAVRAALPADAVVPVLRLLGAPAPDATPEQAKQELHDAVVHWLAELAEASPVALLVEDLHWADRATVLLLADVGRRLRERRLALLMTTRPEGADALAELGASDVVRLAPLDVDGVGDLVRGVLGNGAGDDLARLLHESTGGNPLFAEELVRSLHESDALVATSGGWQPRPSWDRSAVPTTVEQVFATRLDALTPPAAALLQTAAVIGRVVPLPLLQAVMAPDGVEEPLRQVVATGLLERGAATVTFHHALLQEVVQARLLRKRRRELHRRVADEARRLYGDGDDTIDLLARHLYLAEAGEEAVEPLVRAGRRAALLHANAAAAVHLERALEVLGTSADVRRDEVQLELADLLLAQGRHDEAREAYDAVRQRTGAPRAWAGSLAARRAGAEYSEALDLWRTAGTRFDPRLPDSAPVWAECANVLAVTGRFAEAVTMLRTALRFLPEGEHALRARLLTQLAYAEGQLQLREDAAAHAEIAVQLARAAEDDRVLVAALRVAGAACAYTGAVERARAHLAAATEHGLRIGLVVEAAGSVLNSGLLSLEHEPSEAAAAFRSALEQFERIGHAAGTVQAAGNLADALTRTGALDEAEQVAERALREARAIGHRLTVADVTSTQAKLLLARGRPDAAAACAEDAADLFLSLDDVGGAGSCLELAVRAAREAGDADRARRVQGRREALAV